MPWTLCFAQPEALSDEEYRQEARTYLAIPCFEKVGRAMIKTMDLEEPQLTGIDFFRVAASDHFEKIENELIDFALEETSGKPKSERMLWYKVGTLYCMKAWKEKMLEKGMIPEMTQSIQKSLESENEPDNSISEEQPNSDTSVSAQAKRNAVKTCKNSLQVLGDIPWFILNACIQQELQAYQEFQRNYGD